MLLLDILSKVWFLPTVRVNKPKHNCICIKVHEIDKNPHEWVCKVRRAIPEIILLTVFQVSYV